MTAKRLVLLGLVVFASILLWWWHTSPIPKAYCGVIDYLNIFVPLPRNDWHWLDPLNSFPVPIFLVSVA
jgi:hypothetical protein